MKRLNAKQILVLPTGKYPDGNGLYLSIYKPGRGKWSLRYTLNKKAREMGLGSFLNQMIKIKKLGGSLQKDRIVYEIISSVLLSTITGFS